MRSNSYVTFPMAASCFYMTLLAPTIPPEVTSIGGHLGYGDTIEVGPPKVTARFLSTNHQAVGSQNAMFVLSKKLMESLACRISPNKLKRSGATGKV